MNSNPKLHCTQNCKQCPFRKNSAPEFFGGNDPNHYRALIAFWNQVPRCHMTQELPEEKQLYCRGAMSLMTTSCTSIRNPEESKPIFDAFQEWFSRVQPEWKGDIFKHIGDFDNHHGTSYMSMLDYAHAMAASMNLKDQKDE
ncbi:MAG: hypothetical protein AAFO96_03530 [Bacteroidota bacterium]